MNNGDRTASQMKEPGMYACSLAAGLAHDFNNTLAAIRSFAELIAKRTHDEAASTFLNHTIEAVDAAAERYAPLLALNRKRCGDSDTRPEELLKGLALVIEFALAKKLIVEVHTADDLWKASLDASLLDKLLSFAAHVVESRPACRKIALSASNLRSRDDDHVLIAARTVEGGEAGEASVALEIAIPVKDCDHSSDGGTHAEQLPMGDGEFVLVLGANAEATRRAQRQLEGLAYSTDCAGTAQQARDFLSAEGTVSVLFAVSPQCDADLRTLQSEYPSIPMIVETETSDTGRLSGAIAIMSPYGRSTLAQLLRETLSGRASTSD